MAKEISREAADAKRQKAISLMKNLGEQERASEFANMSLEEYAERKGNWPKSEIRREIF